MTAFASGTVMASGEALEARRMLDAAISAIVDDQEAALRRFNDGDAAFRKGELYVFCANATGRIVVHGIP